jgi:soluble lytic murein transglycosylase-like protein
MNQINPHKFIPWTILFVIFFTAMMYSNTNNITLVDTALAASDTEIQQANFNAMIDIPEDNCLLSLKFPQTIRNWCSLITRYSLQNNLEPNLIAALVWYESGGDEFAYSHSGAVGLMQIMPRDGLAASFQCANGPCFRNRPTIKQLQDPAFNVEFGTQFLANLVAKFGNLRQALKSYGPMDVGYAYADKVLAIYEKYSQ